MRTPGAVPNLCKADSGLSAMIGILVAISSHLVARYKIPSYTCCNGNTRLVGSQGSTETYPSTTRTCITRLGYFPS